MYHVLYHSHVVIILVLLKSYRKCRYIILTSLIFYID